MNKKKVLLAILDGWGIGNKSHSDAIYSANTPFMDSLYNKYPNSKLFAHGEYVGLPEGQMGNSEVGHSNIGAGRVLYQDLMRINNEIKTNNLSKNKILVEALEYSRQNNKAVHFIGLLSNGGVHSLNTHLYGLIDVAGEYTDKINIHVITDGRDTDPKSGIGFIEELQKYLPGRKAKIASIIGRYYAMDRDKRWERIKLAYDMYVHGKGNPSIDIMSSIEESYNAGITDEFILPIVIVDGAEKPVGIIDDGDVVICYNFRTDRLRELTYVLTQQDLPAYELFKGKYYFVTMANYDESFRDIHILYDKDNVYNTLGEVISEHGCSQLRIAETEKYPHVTFFFSGGRETPFQNEDRIMVNSPKVATYDLQPEMSAAEVTDKVIAEIDKQKYDFICLNFANCDMVGHTGIYPSILKAVEAVDECVRKVITSAIDNDYTCLVTADHGNSDFAINADGSPNTEHSLNPVPLILVSNYYTHIKDGVLSDIAPTILKIMNIPIPSEMTGNLLI